MSIHKSDGLQDEFFNRLDSMLEKQTESITKRYGDAEKAIDDGQKKLIKQLQKKVNNQENQLDQIEMIVNNIDITNIDEISKKTLNRIKKGIQKESKKIEFNIDPYINIGKNINANYLEKQVKKFYDQIGSDKSKKSDEEKFVGYYTRANQDGISFGNAEYDTLYKDLTNEGSKYKSLVDQVVSGYKNLLEIDAKRRQAIKENTEKQKESVQSEQSLVVSLNEELTQSRETISQLTKDLEDANSQAKTYKRELEETKQKARQVSEAIGNAITSEKSNQPTSFLERATQVEQEISDLTVQYERAKAGFKDGTESLLYSLMVGQDGGVKTRDEFISEITEMLEIADAKINAYVNAHGYDSLTNNQFSSVYEDAFKRVRAASAFGIINVNDIFPDKGYHSSLEALYRDFNNNSDFDNAFSSLSDDSFSYVGSLIEQQERLNALQRNGGQDYIKILEKTKALTNEINEVTSNNLNAGNIDTHTLNISSDDAISSADSLEVEIQRIDLIISSLKSLDTEENKYYLESFGYIKHKISALESLRKKIDDDIIAYKTFKKTQRNDQVNIFSSETDHKLNKNTNYPKELEFYWEELEDAILSGSLSGQEAIEKFNNKANELGVTFDDISKKWVDRNPILSTDIQETQQEFRTLKDLIEEAVTLYNKLERNPIDPSLHYNFEYDELLPEQYVGEYNHQNYANTLEDAESRIKKVYKLYTQVQSAFDKGNDINGLVKIDGESFDKRDLEDVREALRTLIIEYVQLGGTIDALPGRYSKAFRETAKDIETNTLAAQENEKQFKENAERLQEVNNSIREHYDTVRDEVLKRTGGNQSLLGDEEILPYISGFDDYDLKDIGSAEEIYKQAQSIIDANKQEISSNEEVIESEKKKLKYRINSYSKGPKLAQQDSSSIVEANHDVVESNNEVVESEKQKRKLRLANRDYIKISSEDSSSAINEENRAAEETDDVMKKAAKSKEKFAKANKKVEESAEKSADSVEEEAKEIENLNGIIDSNENVIDSEGRRIISTTNTDTLRTRTYQDETGRTYTEGFRLNRRSNQWEPVHKELTNYLQLEREAIKTTNDLALAEADLEKERRKNRPDQDVLLTLIEQIDLLENKLEGIRDQARLYDQEGGLGTEYSYDLFEERVSSATDEYSAKLAVKTAKEIRQENEANLKILQNEQKAIDKSNEFLHAQERKVDKIVSKYDASKNAKKPIINIIDKSELDKMVSDLEVKITDYYNNNHVLSEREKTDIKDEIALLELKMVEYQNKEYTTLTPDDLKKNKDIIRNNFDILISKAKEAGDHTSALVTKLEQERDTIDSIGDSNGIKSATEHLKAYRAEFNKLQQDEHLKKIEEKNNKSVYTENYKIIKEYENARNALNNLFKDQVEKGESDSLTQKIKIAEDAVSKLEQKALDAAIAIEKMHKVGKVSDDDYNEALGLYRDAYHNSGNSSDFLKISLDTQFNKHASEIDSIKKSYEQLGLSTSEINEKLFDLNNAYKEVENTSTSIEDRVDKENEYQKVLKKTLSTLKLYDGLKGKLLDGNYNNLESAKQAALDYASSLGTITKDLSYSDTAKKGIYTLTTEIKTANGEVQKLVFNWKDGFDRMTVSTNKLRNELTGLPKAINVIKDKIVNKAADWVAYHFGPEDIFGYVKDWFAYAKQYDDALTSMRKVTDESVETLQAFQKESFDLADKVGTTADQFQNSTVDFLRLGESLEDAKKSAQQANILFNVSEFDSIEDATTSLISMSQAYDELDKTDIIDKLNIVGNNYAISTNELAMALQNSASALKVAGNDIDQAIALTTAANTVVQDYSKVSAGIRTISMRITGATAEELQEVGEDTDGLIETTAKLEETVRSLTAVNGGLGVSILDTNGNFRDTYNILLDIAEIWDEIGAQDKLDGENRQNVLLEALAGKNRASILAAILQNPQILSDVYQTSSQEYKNSATEELNKQLESISGHVAKLQNQWQNLWAETANRDLINWFLDAATAVLKFADQIGVVNVLLLGAGGFLGIKNIGRPKMFGLVLKYADSYKCSLGY